MKTRLRSMLLRAAATTDPEQKLDRVAFAGTVQFAAAAGEGKRPTFSINAYNGGPMQTAFSYYPVILDLTGGRVGRKKLPILLGHDDARPLGQADDVKITAEGVTLSGTITGDDDDAKKVVSHATNGFEWQASVGASVERREFLEAGKTTTVNGRDVTGPLTIARKWTLVETSIVTIGADSTTSAKIAAQRDLDMTFEQWLKANGIEGFETLTAAKQGRLKAAFEAYKAAASDTEPAPGTTTPPKVEAKTAPATAPAAGDELKTLIASAVGTAVGEAQKTWQAEQDRAAAITRIAAGHPDILAKAVAEKWDATKTELEVIKASRPNVAPYVHTPGGPTAGAASADVVQAAICLAGGLPNIEKTFTDQVLQAAHTRYRGRVGLQQILLEAAWAGGYNGMHFDRSGSGMRSILRAAFSTLSLPGILGNSANKFSLAGFNAVEAAWRGISAIRPVSDLKQVTSYRLTGNFEFEELAGDGEIKHGTTGEESFTNRAKTYAKMYVISEEDIINDDLGVLTTIPMRIGRGGAIKFNKVFWTEFLADHATFFPVDASNGNYISGATTTVGSAGMKAAVEKFRRQTDPDGDPLALRPAWMLVPPELEAPALELNKSITVNTGGSSSTSQVPNANIYGGRFPPIVSAYLTSSKEWYLGADPNELAVIESVFLDGVQTPTVESAEADFNQLGIQMRGVFRFGVSKQDHRAAVKSKGEA